MCANLVRNVGARITNVAVHLPHNANVLVTVEQRVLFFTVRSPHAVRSVSLGHCAVCFEARIGENDNQPARVFV